jgi:hypothetical protein
MWRGGERHDGGDEATGAVAGGRDGVQAPPPSADQRHDPAQAAQAVQAGGLAPHTAPVTFRTLAPIPPKVGPWLTLTNSLTGGAADVFGARAANGTPVVLNRRHDGTNQRWRLRDAGGGTFLVQGAATGKCLAVGGTVRAGAPLVQRTCDAASAAQAWRLVTTAYGFSLAPLSVDLVVGVSGSRYYGRRPLVLQTPNQRRYQSWTAVT